MERALAEFDRLFEQILASRPPLAPVPGAVEVLADAPAPPPPDPGRLLRRVTKLFYSGEYSRCLTVLQETGQAASDPRTRGFRGACRALVRGDFSGGIEDCVEAVRAGSLLPDTYCALGIALLAAGDRAKARAAFLKGLSVDPRHSHLRARIRSMGVRRPPVLPFLARSHPLNRTLGRARAYLAGGQRA
ncbi:MAG: hypothetical protein HY900_22760 [Deltaproteobacteria bacterium]|nr:hypothetical protein [Deltaproteobacteria bacterium]